VKKPTIAAVRHAARRRARAHHGLPFSRCGAQHRLGLPEIKLGLIPGAAARSALPRLVGIEGAPMILSGDRSRQGRRSRPAWSTRSSRATWVGRGHVRRAGAGPETALVRVKDRDES
jgi:hypothetical protein